MTIELFSSKFLLTLKPNTALSAREILTINPALSWMALAVMATNPDKFGKYDPFIRSPFPHYDAGHRLKTPALCNAVAPKLMYSQLHRCQDIFETRGVYKYGDYLISKFT